MAFDKNKRAAGSGPSGVASKWLLAAIAAVAVTSLALAAASRACPTTGTEAMRGAVLHAASSGGLFVATVLAAVLLARLFRALYDPREFAGRLANDARAWLPGLVVYVPLVLAALAAVIFSPYLGTMPTLAVMAALVALGRLHYVRRKRRGLHYTALGETIIALVFVALLLGVGHIAGSEAVHVVRDLADGPQTMRATVVDVKHKSGSDADVFTFEADDGSRVTIDVAARESGPLKAALGTTDAIRLTLYPHSGRLVGFSEVA